MLNAATAAALGAVSPLLVWYSQEARAYALLVLGGIGFAYVLAQGFAIGSQGWSFDALANTWGPLAAGQFGMGLGAALTTLAFAMLFSLGLAQRGYFNGDGFVSGSIVAVIASTALILVRSSLPRRLLCGRLHRPRRGGGLPDRLHEREPRRLRLHAAGLSTKSRNTLRD